MAQEAPPDNGGALLRRVIIPGEKPG